MKPAPLILILNAPVLWYIIVHWEYLVLEGDKAITVNRTVSTIGTCAIRVLKTHVLNPKPSKK